MKVIEIPEGYEARIEGNTVILERNESKDERIRNWIVYYIHRGAFNEEEHPMALKAIEWLEKQKEQPDEQPEYGYLSTKYVHGREPRWSVGDVLAYYICTSNEEGEYLLGKIVNVEFDEEDGWVYTFEDKSIWDEQSLVEEEAYKKN